MIASIENMVIDEFGIFAFSGWIELIFVLYNF